MELADFIAARLDEDEAAAQACADSPGALKWSLPDHPSSHRAVEDEDGCVVVWDEGEPSEWQAAHIARSDPARALREVAAKRAICQRHEPYNCHYCAQGDWCPEMKHVAGVWLDHPDYRDDWKP